MADAREILKQYWGFDNFRPLQEDIINSVLEGNDTLAILPTGGGKSICFQVPALATEGLCIVVSPLIALMKDQVDNLRKKDIPALLIHSGMKRGDVERTLKNATHDYFKFLYVSPERLETSLFREYLPALNVNLIAVDEAHCISQWGYDFRPSYLRIARLREELPEVPVLALTASATTEVQEDICKQLSFGSQRIFRQSFSRKNLSYSVFHVDSKLARLTEIIKKVPGSAIVYCKSRRRTSEIMKLLQMNGLSASNYHAGLSTEERSQRQTDWINNTVKIMVCTNAFGMGIDKPDVRLVVHADMPDCLENYYQEAGRAGRDGKKSYAVLLYDENDVHDLENLESIRYPSFEQIRNVYQALVHYLQIPAYTGEYRGYDFRYEEFTSHFKLNSHETMYALKALEQDGWINYHERNFAPSTVVFTISKNNLYEFERSYPEYEPLLTTMLRTYGGIFDFPAFISEKLLARLMKKEESWIRQQLRTVSAYGVISFTPQNEEPQIVFQKHRVPVSDFRFNLVPYNKRKEQFSARVRQMISYARTENCRSKFIGRYFGELKARECGICDNCLSAKNTSLTPEELVSISELITKQLKLQKLSAADLIQEINIKNEKALQVIEFLQSENRIEMDRSGLLGLKGK